MLLPAQVLKKNLAQDSLRIFEWWRGLEQPERQKHFRLFCALEQLLEHRHGVHGGLRFDELYGLGKAGRDAFLTQIIRDERSKIANAMQGE
jgi:hypothetical protein